MGRLISFGFALTGIAGAAYTLGKGADPLFVAFMCLLLGRFCRQLEIETF